MTTGQMLHRLEQIGPPLVADAYNLGVHLTMQLTVPELQSRSRQNAVGGSLDSNRCGTHKPDRLSKSVVVFGNIESLEEVA